jgi:hypothetical protein
VPCAGISGTRCRSAMSRSYSPSAVYRQITRRSGVGCNVTAPNWHSGCAGILNRPTNPGGSMRRIFESRADGVTSTGPSIPPVPPSTSCCRRYAMRAAAERLFRKTISDPSHSQPRVINSDKARLYDSAIAAVKAEGTLRRHCRHRPVQYLNNILEQDHRAIKRRVKAKQSFREFQAARRTIEGYEAMHMIRKGQARWVSADDVCQQNQFIDQLFDLAA